MTRLEPTRGFTLIETLLATAIFSLIIVGVFTIYASSGTLFNRGQSRTEAHQNARVAVELAAREVRMAGFDLADEIPGLTQASAVQVGRDTELVFVADMNRDGSLDQVTYKLFGGELRRAIAPKSGSGFGTPVWSVVADGLSDLRFTYTDDSTPTNVTFTTPVPAADLDDVRRIKIGLTTADTAVTETAAFTHVVDIRLRN